MNGAHSQARRIRSIAALGSAALALGAFAQRPLPLTVVLRHPPPCAQSQLCRWPAEPPSSALNLTAIEGPGANDFYEDLSGAFWNPFQQALWVCRNGGVGGSKIWKLVPNGSNSFQVGTVGGQRAEWTNFGDCEALALASFAEPNILFTVEESSNSIQEWDLSTSSAVLRHMWNLSAFVPTYAGGLGLEGLAFVPDSALILGAFVDANGARCHSKQGMGALAFVGHQNGGHIYVFDLNRTTGAFRFVGKYATGDPEVAELSFDPTLGVVYAWHGDSRNDLEVLTLSSQLSSSMRKFDRVLTYDFPGMTNIEGFTPQWSPGSCVGARGAFVLTDDGGANSFHWFRQFPCGL